MDPVIVKKEEIDKGVNLDRTRIKEKYLVAVKAVLQALHHTLILKAYFFITNSSTSSSSSSLVSSASSSSHKSHQIKRRLLEE